MTTPHPHFRLSRRSLLLTALGSATQLGGCGGGAAGSLAGLSSGGTGAFPTGSFTSGTISGLGSIIVNGIRYDDTSAVIVSKDGLSAANTALKLGMVVSIQGSAVTAATVVGGTPTATASKISFGSEWLGPVQAVATSSFDVLGHTVDVLASTVFEGAATQLTQLLTTHFVEVYGFLDTATGRLQASRVDVTLTTPTQYLLSGLVSQLNLSQRQFQIGTEVIAWATNIPTPSTWANGAQVWVQMDTNQTNGVWNATRVELVASPLANLQTDDHDEAEVEGTVTTYTSNTSFSVNGLPVNASSATISGTLALGVRVEVKGTISGNTVLAQTVEVKSSTVTSTKTYEFHGQISQHNATTQTFVVRDYTFHFGTNTVFKNVNLATNATPNVELEAQLINGTWEATEVKLDD